MENPPITEAQRKQYEQGWTTTMVKIWRERMLHFRPPVYHTGRLYNSLAGVLHPGANTTIEFRFMQYGLYVAAGVGKEYSRDKTTRDFYMQRKTDRGSGFRQRRDWYSKKYLASIHRLNEFEARAYGDIYQGLMAEALTQIFK